MIKILIKLLFLEILVLAGALVYQWYPVITYEQP